MERAGTTRRYRWKFYDPVLLTLYPATYVLHLFEEWFASAPIVHWGLHASRPLVVPYFVGLNGVGLLLMVVGISLVRDDSRFQWIVPALGTSVVLNTIGHVVGSAVSGGYSAGLITAVVFWIPLGLLTLIRVWDQASARMLRAGLLVGAAIEVLVTAVLPIISS